MLFSILFGRQITVFDRKPISGRQFDRYHPSVQNSGGRRELSGKLLAKKKRTITHSLCMPLPSTSTARSASRRIVRRKIVRYLIRNTVCTRTGNRARPLKITFENNTFCDAPISFDRYANVGSIDRYARHDFRQRPKQ